MKNKIILFVLCFFILCLSGCGSINKDMFNNYFADIKNAKALAIFGPPIENGKITKKSYLVSVDENNKISKVEFYNEQGHTISQDDIKGQIEKLYVTDKFIYISFTSARVNYSERASSDSYDKYYYKLDNNTQSFVISKENYKVYSLSEFKEITQIYGNIIHAKDSFFMIDIKDGKLISTDLIPNKNISPYKAFSDKYGTVFIQNYASNETYKNCIFYTGNKLCPGSDGFVYMVSHSDNSYEIKKYNDDMEPVVVTGNTTCSFEYDGDYFIIKDKFLYEFDDLIEVHYNKINNEYKSWDYIDYSLNKLCLGTEIFKIRANNNNKELVHYNLISSQSPNVVEHSDHYGLTGDYVPPEIEVICPATEAYVCSDAAIFAKNISVAEEKQYIVYIEEDGEIKCKPTTDFDFEGNILTYQPLYFNY